jgi:hypothetical protein
MNPQQVDEAANLAEELHGMMFAPQTEKVEDEQPEVEQEAQDDSAVEGKTEDESFRARYEVLQGKYNAEVPRLNQELKQLKQMVFERLGNVEKPAEPKVEVPAYEAELNQIREQYGDEFINAQRLIAKIEAEELLKQRLEPMQQSISSVEETQVQAAQENFKSYLGNAVKGDWESLWNGQDQKFLEFLNNREPTSGLTYKQIVDYHNNNWDADGLASVMNHYLEGQQPKPKQEQPRQPNPAREAMVAPSRSQATSAPANADKRIWTQDMIAQFQKDDRMGKFDSDTSKVMWDDLLGAISDGRIR